MAAPDLAAMLRSETQQLHTAAERTGIMPELLRGKIERSTYCRLLRSFHPIYSTLEGVLERHAARPHLGALQFPGLSRRAALAADLNFLHGDRWKAEIPLALAASRYVERLNYLDSHEPELLIAHSYVRYLGDLSGGQALRRIVATALQLEGDAGVGFYIFANPNAVDLAASYRRGLRSIEIDVVTKTRIVAEAQAAFRRHIDLFDELAATTVRA